LWIQFIAYKWLSVSLCVFVHNFMSIKLETLLH
jgi:hypothetical protein